MPNTLTETKQQTLGRGKIYFKETGQSGFRYLGNTPSFGLTITTESLRHFNSDSGVRVQDKQVPISTEYAGALVTDNVNYQNLAALLLGTAATVTQTSATGETAQFAAVEQGALYDLGAKQVSAVVVEVATVAKTLGIDYTVDLARGHILIVKGGTIADGATVDVTFNRAAISYNRAVSAGNAKEGSLLFVADNPEGENIDYLIPDAKMTPNGEFQIKAEEWQQLPFNIEISVPDDATPAITANGQPYTP